MRHRMIIVISFFFLSLLVTIQSSAKVFSLNDTNNVIKNSTWISIRDDLAATLELVPKVPIIDETTKLLFEVRNLNGSHPDNLNAKVTMTDHDRRLYKFENKSIPIINGQFFVYYIFPDDGEHRIILQLYKNTTPFAVSTFDVLIPHPIPRSNQDKLLDPLTEFFNFFQ